MGNTMSMYRSKDDMISDMRAEITQLRAELALALDQRNMSIGEAAEFDSKLSACEAELAAERELADRLAAQLDIDRHIVAEAAMTGFNYNDGDWPDRLFANNGAITRHITEHATRRAK